MPITKRFNELQGLANIDVFFDERGLASEFFNISEFPEPLQVGKNSFLMAGSDKLKNFTELKIDIVDSAGNSVYHEPVREYLEGNMRRISVEVYDTNAPGTGFLYIVGEVDPDTVDITDEWKGIYNVRYTRPISINTTQINTQPIFFYKQPKIRAREITKAFIEELPASASYTITGSLTVTATTPGTQITSAGPDDDFDENPAVTVTGADRPGKFLDTYKNRRLNKRLSISQPTVLALGRIQRRASPEPPTHTITIQGVESSPENDQDKITSAFVGGKLKIESPRVDESTYYIGSNAYIKTPSTYVTRIQEVINSTTLIPESPFVVEVHPSPQSDDTDGYYDPNFDDWKVWSSTQPDGKVIDDPTPRTVDPPQPDTPYTDETGAIWLWGEVTDTTRIPSEPEAGGNSYVNYYGWSASGSEDQSSADDAIRKETVSMLPNSNVTMSIIPTPEKKLTATHLRSYADFSIVNMRTFSGDIFRVKIYGKIRGALTDFELLYDSPTESPEILIDPYSVDGFTNVGYFYTGSIVSNYWATSSNSVINQNNDYLSDGVLISGSNYELGEEVEFFTTSSYQLERNVSYAVGFDSYYIKQPKKVKVPAGPVEMDGSDGTKVINRAELKVYLSGSRAKDGTGDIGEDIYLGKVSVPDGPTTTEGEQKGVYQIFKSAPKHFPTAQLKFVATSGQWAIRDVSLKPTAETNFSPDYFRTIVPIPYIHKRPAQMDFLVEFYDVDGKIATSFGFLENFRIVGAPQVVAQGDNNLLSGSMYLGNLQGHGIELHGGSAFLRSVGYEGFQSSISSGSGGFMIWSGSLSGTRSDGSPFLSTTESYDGVGLEIVDAHGATDRYLKFRTNPSTFEVVTDQFFLGNAGAHISSSGGSLTITSSNFHLDKDGDVNMAGTVTATAGKIGDFDIISGKISGSNITMDANNSTIYKTDQGPGSDSSATFDQLRDEYYIDFTPETESPDNYYIKMGPNFMVDKEGILIASGAEFIGTVTASAGLIGGFNIGSASLYAGSSEHSPNFYISGSASGNLPGTGTFISSSRFQVTAEGDITASAGLIGGWTIADNTINKLTSTKYSGLSSTGTTRFFAGADNLTAGTGSAVFNVKSDGVVSASEGLIGGWTIADNTINKLTSTKYSGLSSYGDTRFFAGADNLVATGSAVFNVKADGVVTASEGLIGGWRINPSPEEIRSPNERLVLSARPSHERITVKNSSDEYVLKIGEISTDTSDMYGIKIYDGTNTPDDNVGTGTVVMLGDLGNKIGGWQITDTQIRTIPDAGFGGEYDFDAGEEGLILQSNPTESRIETAGFVSGLKGFRMSSLGNGSAEFENMRIRGTLRTTVFEKESVNVVGGQLMVANSTTIQSLKSGSVVLAGTSSVSATDVTMSVANASGFSRGEILKVKAVDDVGFNVEYLYVTGSKRFSEDPDLAYLTASLDTDNNAPPLDPDGIAGELYVGRGYGSSGPSQISSSISYVSGAISIPNAGDAPTLGATDTIYINDTGSLSVQNIIKIDEERMKITKISGSVPVIGAAGLKASASLNVIRDFHDTVPAIHDHGASVTKIDADMEFLAGLVSTARPYKEGQVLVSTGKYAAGTDWNGRFDYQKNVSSVNGNGKYKLVSGSTHLTTSNKKDATSLQIYATDQSGSNHDALYSLFDKGSYIVLLVESPYSSSAEWYRYRVTGNPSFTGTGATSVHTFPIKLNQDFYVSGNNKNTENEEVEFWFMSNIQDVSSGYIMMNANPNDPYSPYMDFVERTGSDVYDLQLRTRLGDLSGLSSAYLYGDEEPGFGLYTENGFFRGTLHAMTGSIHGILHVATTRGGIETNQKISIGRDVKGSHDGIQVNNNNYWLTTGEFRLGDSSNYFHVSGTVENPSSNIEIKTDDISIDTSNFILSSSLNSGTIRMGSDGGPSSVSANTAGIYMDGAGDFQVYGDADNYLRFDIDQKLELKAENFELDTPGLDIVGTDASTAANNKITLGTTANANVDGTNTGIYMDGGGDFLIYGDSDNYFKFDVDGAPILDMKAETFYLGDSLNYISGSSGNISIYNTGTTTLSGSSVQIETPKFYLGSPSQYVSGSNGNIEISSSNFHLNNTGDVTMAGRVTATSGEIGGFDISATEISSSGMSMDSANQVLIFKDVDGTTLGTAGQEALRISFDGDSVIPSENTTTTAERARIHVPSGSLAASDLIINTEPLNNVYITPGRLRVFRKALSGAPSDENGKALLTPSGLGNNFNKYLDAAAYFPNSNRDGTFTDMDFHLGVLGYASRNTSTDGSQGRQVAIYGLSNVGKGAISIYGEVLQENNGYSGVFHGGQFVVGDVIGTGGSGADSTTDTDWVLTAYPNDIDGGTYNSYKGRVGINKRLPDTTLHVNGTISGSVVKSAGTISVGSTISAGGNIDTSGILSVATGTESAPAIQIGSANDGFYHLASGDAGINVLVNDEQEFLFADGGGFHADGNITAFSNTTDSDIRLKENIKPLENNLEKVLQLKPSSFKWKIQDRENDIGLIAQDVEKVIPELVKEKSSIGKTKEFLDGDKHKTVDYSKLTTFLIGAVQEQQNQIDELKKKLEEL